MSLSVYLFVDLFLPPDSDGKFLLACGLDLTVEAANGQQGKKWPEPYIDQTYMVGYNTNNYIYMVGYMKH